MGPARQACVLTAVSRGRVSALVRAAHELHGLFDMPPGFGEFNLTLGLEVDCVLGSLGNGLRAMGFQKLARIVMDFDFSHGVMLLWSAARELCRASIVDVDTRSSVHSLDPGAAHWQELP